MFAPPVSDLGQEAGHCDDNGGGGAEGIGIGHGDSPSESRTIMPAGTTANESDAPLPAGSVRWLNSRPLQRCATLAILSADRMAKRTFDHMIV